MIEYIVCAPVFACVQQAATMSALWVPPRHWLKDEIHNTGTLTGSGQYFCLENTSWISSGDKNLALVEQLGPGKFVIYHTPNLRPCAIEPCNGPDTQCVPQS